METAFGHKPCLAISYMKPYCTSCEMTGPTRPKLIRHGRYFRTSDSRWIDRYKCNLCYRCVSIATFQPCYRQRKRYKNEMVRRLLCSAVSLRGTARILNLDRKTVTRKFLFLSLHAEFNFRKENLRSPLAHTIEFDDLETFESTKCKPLSVTLAVESKSRRILGLEVSVMPSKGKLARKSREKYGPRPDLRRIARRRLLNKMRELTTETVLLKSDSNPHYPSDVKKYFPGSRHITYMGKRGASTGQGELKKIRFDPLFSLNHTCAMLRANVNRLFRKTWCTTKRRDHLYAHLILYADHHNRRLRESSG